MKTRKTRKYLVGRGEVGAGNHLRFVSVVCIIELTSMKNMLIFCNISPEDAKSSGNSCHMEIYHHVCSSGEHGQEVGPKKVTPVLRVFLCSTSTSPGKSPTGFKEGGIYSRNRRPKGAWEWISKYV